MSWSYSGDPSTSSRDEIRFLVGDTDEDLPLLQDEEIDHILALYPSTSGAANYKAAAVVAEIIAAQFAKKADKSVGGLSISYTQKYDRYISMAEALRQQARTVLVGPPVLGGGGQTYLGPEDSDF